VAARVRLAAESALNRIGLVARPGSRPRPLAADSHGKDRLNTASYTHQSSSSVRLKSESEKRAHLFYLTQPHINFWNLLL